MLGMGGASRFRYESLFCRNRDRENQEYRNFRFFNLKFRIFANFGKIGNIFFGILYYLLKVRYSCEATIYIYALKRSGAEKFDHNNFLVPHTRSIRLNFCISVQEGPRYYSDTPK